MTTIFVSRVLYRTLMTEVPPSETTEILWSPGTRFEISDLFPHRSNCLTCEGSGEGRESTYCRRCGGAGEWLADGMMIEDAANTIFPICDAARADGAVALIRRPLPPRFQPRATFRVPPARMRGLV